MITKSFVSLYFLPNKLQLVQLDTKTKKALKVASVNLPVGIIEAIQPEGVESSYTVKNTTLLAKIIHSTWSKLHIKERSVGIVIPEFASYTKLIAIPKVTASELDEAVKWQIQEYFPAFSGKMLMDWKIAEKTDSEYQVIAVMIQKNLLQGYVDACEIAGLFPLIVATPSLVLTRLAGEDDPDGRLIVYKGLNESILIAAKEKKIVGTASIPNPDDAELEKTTRRIISHYSDLKIKTIYAGGSGIVKESTEELEKAFSKPVKKVIPAIPGLSEEGISDYLIPIALQFKEAYEPSDPRTVNLLPPGLEAKYKSAQMRLRVWGLTLTLTLFIWLCFISTAVAYFYLDKEITDFKQKNSSINAIIARRKALSTKIKEINETSDKVSKIQSTILYPETAFNDIKNAKPAGVTITGYKMDLDTGLIKVSGKSNDRTSLIEFQDNLEKNKNITDVTLPISSLEVETNLSFELSYVYALTAPTPQKGAAK